MLNETLKISKLGLGDAARCVGLQSTLTEAELSVYGKRSKNDYEEMIESGLMFGIHKEENLIAQIGTKLHHERKEYIVSENPAIAKLLDESVIIEQGAYIIQRNYRGHGLQGELEKHLAKEVKELIGNTEKLRVQNQKLHELLVDNRKPLLLVSGCSSENPASALTSLNNGSMLIGTKNVVVNEGEEELTAYALIKPMVGIEKIEYDNSPRINSEIKELLKERETIVKSNYKKLERQQMAMEISRTRFGLQKYPQEPKEIKVNPLPKQWVEKVCKAGYVVTRDKNKQYQLQKPKSIARI